MTDMTGRRCTREAGHDGGCGWSDDAVGRWLDDAAFWIRNPYELMTARDQRWYGKPMERCTLIVGRSPMDKHPLGDGGGTRP